MHLPETHAEIIFPVRTLADFIAADESGEIPATEPPTFRTLPVDLWPVDDPTT